ncbi:uncharacterized protein LOC142331257 [Lycorma delicatula]|uniref:uncharacterized protein LOC142331257 n=1 Tax=Lycorma delicatula TaxID=130591 RepID=UPI003F5110BD
MAPFIIVDKVIASVFLLVLFNVNQGQCNFYPPLAIGRPEGQQQALFEINEPQNRVGYSYKPAWADIHFQPFLEDTRHHQQQSVDRIQQQLTPSYTVPAHTYLQSSDKYQISPPKYQWSVQPSVYQNIPSLSNPLFPRDPQQQSSNVLVPLRLFGVQSFPPFLESLIQRVQTYYSIYNPPDTLTIPHNINTPPTFTASSLLPPFDTFFPTDNEENTPNIDSNSVENNEGTIEPGITTELPPDNSGNNESSTEESTATDSKAEDSTKADTEESTTASSSTDEKTDEKKSDESGNETTTAASDNSDDESVDLKEEAESTATNIGNGENTSTEAENDGETTTSS